MQCRATGLHFRRLQTVAGLRAHTLAHHAHRCMPVTDTVTRVVLLPPSALRVHIIRILSLHVCPLALCLFFRLTQTPSPTPPGQPRDAHVQIVLERRVPQKQVLRLVCDPTRRLATPTSARVEGVVWKMRDQYHLTRHLLATKAGSSPTPLLLPPAPPPPGPLPPSSPTPKSPSPASLHLPLSHPRSVSPPLPLCGAYPIRSYRYGLRLLCSVVHFLNTSPDQGKPA